MKLIIDEFGEGHRTDIYLKELNGDFSRSKIQTYIKEGKILVNSKTVKPSYIFKQGDVVEISDLSSDEVIEPENIPLEIVWEDENMLVVNKPSGMLTHPATTEKNGTLVNALLYRYGNNLSDINGEFRRGILHRLDRNTSGLLMIAKNNQTHEYLTEKMKSGEVEKKYIAVLKGIIDEDEYTINLPISRNPSQPHKMCVSKDGKESITKVKVLERYKDATLAELHLITGRTHQIRVHLSYTGHPVYNDTLYGFGKVKIKTAEQVLQSYKLAFPEPFDGRIIKLQIPYDNEVQKVITYLKSLKS